MGALEGKVAVVTGAASGIGLASARRMRAEGAQLVLVDVQHVVHEAADELGARAVVADVGAPRSWEQVVAVAEGLGGVDIALLNAGTAIGQEDIGALTDDEYRRIMSVNVDGVVYGARAVVPAIGRRGGGAVVVTASLAGLIAFPGDPVYTATKHAVIGFVRSLAPTLRRQGITINAVCPSLVDTPLIDGKTRDVLAGAGFPLISAQDVADVVFDCVVGDETGRAIVVQAGLGPTPYRFAAPPAPQDSRAADAVPDKWRG